MKYVLIVFALVFVAPILRCQDAKVVALSAQDAAQAASLDQEQKALDARRRAFMDHVAKTYLVTTDHGQTGDCVAYQEPGSGFVIGRSGVFVPSPPDPKAPPTRYYLRGWGCGGFKYSDDFKYIVPLQDSPRTACNSGLGSMYVTN